MNDNMSGFGSADTEHSRLPTLKQGLIHHKNNNYALAEVFYQQVLEQEPKQTDALHFLGLIAQQYDNHPLAIEYLSQAIHVKQDSPDFYYNLANSLQELQDITAAVETYSKALELDPYHMSAINNLIVAYQKQGHLQQGIKLC